MKFETLNRKRASAPENFLYFKRYCWNSACRAADSAIGAMRRVSIELAAPSKSQTQLCLFLFGCLLLVCSSATDSEAARTIRYNAAGPNEAVNALLLYLEGSFGALVMVCSGIGAILSSAFGQYRASLGLMVVAIGSFILRSLMSTFFNDAGIAP